jgi:lipopolysaccharide export system permease protein
MRSTLHGMLLRSFLPVFLIATAFFVTMLQLVDIFQNITRYIDLEVSFQEVVRVQMLYLPKSLHFSLPMSLLFAVAFTLGSIYANNELIAVLGSGVSLRAFVMPLIIVGISLSAGSFLFEEYVVIETLRQKNELERQLLNVSQSASNSNVTRLGAGARVVYHADYYNDATESLSGVVIVERDNDGRVTSVISARQARWVDGNWEIQSGRFFSWAGDDLVERFASREIVPSLVLSPTAFKRRGKDIDELRLAEAELWIQTQRDAGLPYREDLTKYHERFSFALTPFVVVFISSAIGGRFRKNILLMSLLVSLSVSVVYYVIQMIAGLMAYSGFLSPILGAWAGFLVFFVLGLTLFRLSRT